MLKLNLEKCTACGACVQKCPKGCISLATDTNGFLYPHINVEECIECGMCEKVCPIGDTLEEVKQKAYACANKEERFLSQVTSGGVFGAIASFVLEKGGIVFVAS